MINETKKWIMAFVEIHQTDIKKQLFNLQKTSKRLENNDTITQQMTEKAIIKRVLYHQAQLDLLQVLILVVKK